MPTSRRNSAVNLVIKFILFFLNFAIFVSMFNKNVLLVNDTGKQHVRGTVVELYFEQFGNHAR